MNKKDIQNKKQKKKKKKKKKKIDKKIAVTLKSRTAIIYMKKKNKI